MPRHPSVPSYRLHKASGQAVVTLGGRDCYLGVYGTPESRAAYERIIAEWLANGRVTPKTTADLTVSEVLAAYWAWVERTSAPNPTRIKAALKPAQALYGTTAAAAFNGPALKACRQALVGNGHCRKYVNQLIDTLRRAFKWAVGEDLVPADVLAKLEAVEGLRAGRTEAPESAPVLPADLAHVRAAQQHVLPQVRDLIDLQLLTGCRPGEAVILRPADLDKSADVWTYVPQRHKTQHIGKSRTIWLGPRAQAVVVPYLDRPPTAYCFSPTEAETGRRLALHQSLAPQPRTLDRYAVSSYSRAVRRACLRAGVPCWSPHALRHTAATFLVQEFGWDVARLILGHSSISTTRVYAQDIDTRAKEAMRRVG